MNKICSSFKTFVGKIRNAKLTVTIKTPFVNFSFAPMNIIQL